MSPATDRTVVKYSENDTIVEVLKGAVTARLLSHDPSRSFAIEATFNLHKGAEFFFSEKNKPPMHFHVAQEEYVECLQGKLVVETKTKTNGPGPGPLRQKKHEYHFLTPEDGRFCIRPYVNHRLYPAPLEEQQQHIVKFLLSGAKTDSVFGELNDVFFENWYGYQDEVVVRGAGHIDLFQLFCTFDAGGTYVSFPGWVPFGQSISIALGVVLGRWIGSGLLGYQPFYRKWTTDWELACQKMENSIFQRRFADRSKTTLGN